MKIRPDYDALGLPGYLEAVRKRLVPYQLEVVDHLIDNPKCAIDSVGGTGKSLMALYATFSKRPKAVIIVCSSNALYTWIKEIDKWFKPFAKMCVVVEGQPAAKRKKIWQQDALFFICTYGTLRADQKEAIAIKADVIISDEYHKGGLKNPKSQATKVFKELEPYAESIIPTSGSGIRKGPQDLWGLLNILNRKRFTSYWQFIGRYCIVEETHFGKQIVAPKHAAEMLETIKPNYIRVPRSISEAQKPKLLRKVVSLTMTPTQKKYYHQLNQDMAIMYTNLKGEFDMLASSTVIGLGIKLRKLLICPQMLDIPDLGAGIDAVLDQIDSREDPHTVIFTPFLDAIPIFKEELQKRLPNVHVMTLQGGDDWQHIKDTTDQFRASRNTLVICSLMFAQSFELETAQHCHFLGYDWDQNSNEQCEWRLQRMTADITLPITAYYYAYRNTIDDDILSTLNTNTLNVQRTFKSIDQLQTHLKGELHDNVSN